MEITILIKNVYGREVIYPACEVSKYFAQLVQQKTLTERDLALIAKMGYKIKIASEERNFIF